MDLAHKKLWMKRSTIRRWNGLRLVVEDDYTRICTKGDTCYVFKKINGKWTQTDKK